jgi:outer membrane immunogenic protein
MKYIVAGAFALAIAAPAAAQDAAPVSSGPRIEARVGWDRPVIEAFLDDGVDSISDKAGKSGVTYGVEAGYDIVAGGPSLIGIYGGIEDSSVKECLEIYGNDRGCVEAGRNITAGARVGFVTNRGVVYLKGGYSNGRATVSYSDPAAPSDNFRLSENLDGFHLGAGGEVMFGRNVYGKLEYVYTNYGGFDYDDGDVAAGLDVERHQVVAGVGFRF